MRRTSFRDEGGEIHASEPEPGVLHFVVEGRLSAGLAQHFIDFAQESAGEKLSLYHDWWEVETYDDEARHLLTRWTLDERARIVGEDILARAKAVKLALAAANLALGGLAKLHDSPASFRAALCSSPEEATTT